MKCAFGQFRIRVHSILVTLIFHFCSTTQHSKRKSIKINSYQIGPVSLISVCP